MTSGSATPAACSEEPMVERPPPLQDNPSQRTLKVAKKKKTVKFKRPLQRKSTSISADFDMENLLTACNTCREANPDPCMQLEDYKKRQKLTEIGLTQSQVIQDQYLDMLDPENPQAEVLDMRQCPRTDIEEMVMARDEAAQEEN